MPVAALLGKTRNDVMPPISKEERMEARLSSIGFWMYGSIISFIVFIFFIGDALMSARLIFVGAGAIFDRFRPLPPYLQKPNDDFKPAPVLQPGTNYNIGDTSHDMRMAVNARVYAQGVSWGFHTTEEITAAGALHVAHSFEELDAALDQFAATLSAPHAATGA